MVIRYRAGGRHRALATAADSGVLLAVVAPLTVLVLVSAPGRGLTDQPWSSPGRLPPPMMSTVPEAAAAVPVRPLSAGRWQTVITHGVIPRTVPVPSTAPRPVLQVPEVATTASEPPPPTTGRPDPWLTPSSTSPKISLAWSTGGLPRSLRSLIGLPLR
jgi:hypothetical protein